MRTTTVVDVTTMMARSHRAGKRIGRVRDDGISRNDRGNDVGG